MLNVCDPWENNKLNSATDIYSFVRSLEQKNYRGYLRFITGPSDSAVQRLSTSFVGDCRINFALVHGELVSLQSTKQLRDLISLIAPHGLIIFTHSKEREFQDTWSKIQSEFPKFVYVLCRSGKTGLILTDDISSLYLAPSLDAGKVCTIQVTFSRPKLSYSIRHNTRKLFRVAKSRARHFIKG